MEKVLIIAEPGCCMMGDLPTAYRMIEAVAEAGADCFKAQWTSNPAKMAARRNAPEYEAIYSRYIAWPRGWHEKLKERCGKAGIEYMCTTYLSEDIAVVDPYVKRFKISSFECADQEFVDSHVRFDKDIIISLGLGGGGIEPKMLIRPSYLHCVTAYPCPLDQLNLSCLSGVSGLSDHTTSVLTGAVAVGAGARIIEKHVRLRDTPEDNPDYGHSLPLTSFGCGCQHYLPVDDDFEQYVKNVREAEKMMGSGEKRVMPCEEAMKKYKVKP